MPWSTRELAELVGVTLRSIRHWHDVGLLPEPERLTNGYKQYTAQHLVLALRIARLSGLGFTLDQVADALASEEHGRASLRELQVELDDRIGELTRLREQVDGLIDQGVSPDLSPEALLAEEALGDDPSSRSIAIVLARIIPGERMPALVKTLKGASADLGRVEAEIRRMPSDAQEEEISSLAERTAAAVDEFLAETANTLPAVEGVDDRTGTEMLSDLLMEHMNPAQRRVMALVIRHLSEAYQ